jgi:membrane-associated phospholipid phosphatase
VSHAKRIVPAYVLIVIAVLAMGWLLTHPLLHAVNSGFDNPLARWFADHRTPTLDSLTEAGAFVGSTLVFAIGSPLVALAAWFWRRAWAPVLVIVLATAGVAVLYLGATQLISRQRPPVHILDPGLVPDHSFPSGHTLFATALYGGLAVVLWASARPASYLLCLVPLVVAVSRLYQGAHHLTDVLTSLVAGALWLVVLARTLSPGARSPGAGSRRR